MFYVGVSTGPLGFKKDLHCGRHVGLPQEIEIKAYGNVQDVGPLGRRRVSSFNSLFQGLGLKV